jgi:hypothetical protein
MDQKVKFQAFLILALCGAKWSAVHHSLNTMSGGSQTECSIQRDMKGNGIHVTNPVGDDGLSKTAKPFS